MDRIRVALERSYELPARRHGCGHRPQTYPQIRRGSDRRALGPNAFYRSLMSKIFRSAVGQNAVTFLERSATDYAVA